MHEVGKLGAPYACALNQSRTNETEAQSLQLDKYGLD